LPVTPSAFAIEGMKRTLGIVQSVRQGLNPELRDYRVCLSMMDGTPVSRAIANDIVAAQGDNVLASRAQFDRDVNKAALCRTPAVLFNPEAPFARSVTAMAADLCKALGFEQSPAALEAMGTQLATLHEQRKPRFKDMAKSSGALAANAASLDAQERRPRLAGGRLSSFAIGGVIGAACGFFAKAYL
jgi:hypothetical protein